MRPTVGTRSGVPGRSSAAYRADAEQAAAEQAADLVAEHAKRLERAAAA